MEPLEVLFATGVGQVIRKKIKIISLNVGEISMTQLLLGSRTVGFLFRGRHLLRSQDVTPSVAPPLVSRTFWHFRYNLKPYRKISITLLVSVCVYFKVERINCYNLFQLVLANEVHKVRYSIRANNSYRRSNAHFNVARRHRSGLLSFFVRELHTFEQTDRQTYIERKRCLEPQS